MDRIAIKAFSVRPQGVDGPPVEIPEGEVVIGCKPATVLTGNASLSEFNYQGKRYVMYEQDFLAVTRPLWRMREVR